MGTIKLRCDLTAAILNYEQEAGIYEWLALIVPDYGTRPFNKRLETWLNKLSADRFGTHTVENWGGNGASKEFENVRFAFRKSDYSDKFELSFYYAGQATWLDYDDHSYKLHGSNEHETLSNITDANDLATRARELGRSRLEYKVKLQDNLANIDALAIEHDQLRADIKAFNDKLTFAISDDLRIRG